MENEALSQERKKFLGLDSFLIAVKIVKSAERTRVNAFPNYSIRPQLWVGLNSNQKKKKIIEVLANTLIRPNLRLQNLTLEELRIHLHNLFF